MSTIKIRDEKLAQRLEELAKRYDGIEGYMNYVRIFEGCGSIFCVLWWEKHIGSFCLDTANPEKYFHGCGHRFELSDKGADEYENEIANLKRRVKKYVARVEDNKERIRARHRYMDYLRRFHSPHR